MERIRNLNPVIVTRVTITAPFPRLPDRYNQLEELAATINLLKNKPLAMKYPHG
jgi:hypothetical protein